MSRVSSRPPGAIAGGGCPASDGRPTGEHPLSGGWNIAEAEGFVVTLSGATGATIDTDTAAGTILNDDSATLSINDVTATEDGTLTFTIFSDKFASEDMTVLVNTLDIPGCHL